MRWILSVLMVLAGLAAGRGAVAEAELAVDLELVLAVDVSGSIDPSEAALQRQGYVRAMTSPEVIGAATGGPHGRIAVSYLEWAGLEHVRLLVGWHLIDGLPAAEAFAARLADADIVSGQRTSISGAVLSALPLFRGNGFAGTRRVIDISADGPNNNGLPVLAARDAAIAAGVSLNGLAILNDRIGPYGFPSWRTSTSISRSAWSPDPAPSCWWRKGSTISARRYGASWCWRSPASPRAGPRYAAPAATTA